MLKTDMRGGRRLNATLRDFAVYINVICNFLAV